MQLIKALLTVVLYAAAVSGLQLACRPRSQCDQPFLRGSGRTVFCNAGHDIIVCRTGTAGFKRQPAASTGTTDTNTIPISTTVTTDASTTVGSPVSRDSFEPQLGVRDGQSPGDLQNLQGNSNLGQRFGSRLQGQAQRTVQGLQALSGQQGRRSQAARPQTAPRGGFFRGRL